MPSNLPVSIRATFLPAKNAFSGGFEVHKNAVIKSHHTTNTILLTLQGDVFLPYIVDPGNRTAYITEKVNLAKTQFLDGINIDIEHAVEAGSAESHALTALVKESTEAFHREIPGSQVRGQ